MSTPITKLQNTYYSSNAEFIKLEVPNSGTYYFSSSYRAETMPSGEIVDPQFIDSDITVDFNNTTTTVANASFTPLGALVGISGHQRDLQVTAYDTSITLQGIDQKQIGVVLDANNGTGPKGSIITIWRGFYNDDLTLDQNNIVKRYTGVVTGYNIEEQRIDQIDAFTLVLHCSSFKKTLENRIAGRLTNDKSWRNFYPADPSMSNVAALNNAKFNFGQKLA